MVIGIRKIRFVVQYLFLNGSLLNQGPINAAAVWVVSPQRDSLGFGAPVPQPLSDPRPAEPAGCRWSGGGGARAGPVCQACLVVEGWTDGWTDGWMDDQVMDIRTSDCTEPLSWW